MGENKITEADLGPYDKFEKVDIVRGDLETTEFKQRARLHQSRWREKYKLIPGEEPMRPLIGRKSRKTGSRIALDTARVIGANFISESAWKAASDRVANRQPHEMLDKDRLFSDLLSSMPMCFNLFGPLYNDLKLANKAIKTWWPDSPGIVKAVHFEWSPGRRIQSEYLGNSSAFDVAFELEINGGKSGVIGIETKYHEHAKIEALPDKDKRLPRYQEVTNASGIFVPEALDRIVGTKLQQIWLDHLLALSMLQHHSGIWTWVKFVLVHPRMNPSYARAAQEYKSFLIDKSTFEIITIEQLLDTGVLPEELRRAITERYLW